MTRHTSRSTLFPYTTLFRSLGKTEVTQAQWIAVMGKNTTRTTNPDQPVVEVSWINAMDFCKKLTEREKSEEHTSELQSRRDLVCRLLLEKKNKKVLSR